MDTFLILLGGVLVVLVASNYHTCSTQYGMADAMGNILASGAACPNPGTCTVVAINVRPSIGCLFNPTTGGL